MNLNAFLRILTRLRSTTAGTTGTRTPVIPKKKHGEHHEGGHHEVNPGGIPGANLPFGKSMQDKLLFTLYTMLFYSSGFNLPFLVLVHQLRKK